MDQENNMGFKNTIRECGTQIAYNLSYEERLQLLAFLAEIAKSDGNVCAAEINALKEVAMAMGMSDREVESMLNLKGSSLDDAYKVLEIEPTATDEEVRARLSPDGRQASSGQSSQFGRRHPQGRQREVPENK